MAVPDVPYRAEWDYPTQEVESSPTVTTSAAELVENNPDRIMLLVVNHGLNPGYIGLASDLTEPGGIPVAANGGSVVFHIGDDASMPSRQWFAVNANANGAWYVLELVRVHQGRG